ncbi:MAG TPA: BlaI/MecI/CopY family transcriptional regulator [Tepidisphaeraceae bacterium]
MANIPVISDAEWEVMEVLWARRQAAADEVVAALAHKKNWHARTVKTLLNRLLKKGALEFEIVGKKYLYRPRSSRDACVKAESQSFLAKIFGGNRGAMLCRFVDETKLSETEIAELRKLLERKSKER